MKRTTCVCFLVLAVLTGCNGSNEPTRWEEVQFRIALRSIPYAKGDVAGCGPFQDLLLISVPVALTNAKGSAHVVQDGVWLHLQWDRVREQTMPEPALVFERLRYRFENCFTSPYGTSWRTTGCEPLGTHAILREWDLIQTPVRIDPSGKDQRIWCKLCRWAPRKALPDIRLGEKSEREPNVPGGS
jgi:hypothetical protein